jgi:ketosteroid isomerase-like protein
VSQENVDLVHRAVEIFNETGSPAWDLYADDVVFRSRGDLTTAETFHGHDGLRHAQAGFREVWGDRIKAEVVEILGSSDALVVVLRFQLRGAQSGVEIAVDESWAMWIRDGKITRVEQYGYTPQALKAVGLEE